MVKPIQGFQSSDGMIFDNNLKALQRELFLAIIRGGGNEGFANTMISNFATIRPAFEAYMSAMDETNGSDANVD